MTQQQLNRAVAQATGESVERVSQMGFIEVPMPQKHPLRMSGLYRRARTVRNTPRASKPASVAALVG